MNGIFFCILCSFSLTFPFQEFHAVLCSDWWSCYWTTIRTSNYWRVSRGQPRCWKVFRAGLRRSCWGCLVWAWRRKGWEQTSSQSAASREAAEGEEFTCSPWRPPVRHRSRIKLRLDTRQRFLTGRGVSHWNRFPREVVTAPNLSKFQGHLDNALSHRV